MRGGRRMGWEEIIYRLMVYESLLSHPQGLVEPRLARAGDPLRTREQSSP